tara:strand:+ start:1952 stop:2761 length:810 start_codon:yes stop_codon:yes gene_type:complete
MIYYSEDTINDLFHNETFLKDCEDYKNTNDELIKCMKFINNIELNKKYFRLEMNKRRGYKKRQQFKETDTTCIKEVNSLLNKLTDKNILSIRTKIKDKLGDKYYLKNLIIDSILEKCIIHTPYISLYLDLINHLYDKNNNDMIQSSSDKLYQSIQNIEFKEESDYLRMCERNKKLDKLIGHSLLVTELEKKKIVIGKIHPALENLIKKLTECEEYEEKYKCVQCLYNIFKSYYGKYILPEGYNKKLKTLIENETVMKIKFKMMDILERR